jgi:prepilin-type N-terminal cleavage/methylation domain-containing protein
MAIIKLKINQPAGVPISVARKVGFTLVEVLVSLSLFSVIAVAVLGVFVSAVKSQRRVLAQQQMTDQASYLIEYISRDIRMAHKDLTGDCIPGGYNYQTSSVSGVIELRFLDYENKCSRFFLDTDKIIKVQKSFNNFPPVSETIYPLVSDNFTVNSFKIIGSGWQQGDSLQPSITFYINMTGRDSIKTQLQTTVSQRNIDIFY